jgi:hypothetical protein
MLKKLIVQSILFAAWPAFAVTLPISDQEAPAAKAESSEPGHAYRVDFVVSELEDGRKINARAYALNLNAGEQDELKIGTRVPVEVKQGEIQYLDVGTSIWCRLRDRRDVGWLANDVMLNVRSEISGFALPDQQAAQSTRPAIRQMKIDSSTIAIVGKQMVVGVVDDPNSKRQFQLELMVTRLR